MFLSLKNEQLQSLAEESQMLKDEMDVLRHSQEKVVCTGLLHAYLQELHNFWNFILNDFPKIKSNPAEKVVLFYWSESGLMNTYHSIFRNFPFWLRISKKEQKFSQNTIEMFWSSGKFLWIKQSCSILPWFLVTFILVCYHGLYTYNLEKSLNSVYCRSLKSSLFLIRSWKVLEIHNLVYSSHLFL